jgi:uncharacterized protein involved in type VI secretion and phage assembly
MPDEPAFETMLADLHEEVHGRYWGKYRGTVKSVDDPETMGRIQATGPSVFGDQVSPWALPAVPFAGDRHGLVLLPEEGDGVWIEFEGGDLSLPIWTGCWWARGEIPPPGAAKVRVLATTGGLKLVMDDDAKKIQIVHPDGPEITLTSSELTLKAGSAKVVLSSSGVSVNDGALTVS